MANEKDPQPSAEPQASETLHSPLKPLLWMALLFAALIAFGAYHQ